jgi:hypothetical protein
MAGHSRPRRVATFTILTVVTTATMTFLAPTAVVASVVVRPRAAEVHTGIDRSAVVQLPFAAPVQTVRSNAPVRGH